LHFQLFIFFAKGLSKNDVRMDAPQLSGIKDVVPPELDSIYIEVDIGN